MSDAGIIVAILLAVGAYLSPTFIAVARNHHNCAAIFVVNLLLGWTFLGWVAALVWSVTAIPARQ